MAAVHQGQALPNVVTTLEEKHLLGFHLTAWLAAAAGPRCLYFYGPHRSGAKQIGRDIKQAMLDQVVLVDLHPVDEEDEPYVNAHPSHVIIKSDVAPEDNPKLGGSILLDHIVRFDEVHEDFIYEAIEIIVFED